MAGERIMEALELGIEDLALMKEYRLAKESQPNLAPPPRNALYIALGGISAERHVLDTVQKIKAASLQDALLVLPFDKVVSLLTFIDIWAQNVCFPFLLPPSSFLCFLNLMPITNINPLLTICVRDNRNGICP